MTITVEAKTAACKRMVEIAGKVALLLDKWVSVYPNAPRPPVFKIEIDHDDCRLEFEDQWSGMTAEILAEVEQKDMDALQSAAEGLGRWLPATAMPVRMTVALEGFVVNGATQHRIDVQDVSLGGVETEVFSVDAKALLAKLDRRLGALALIADVLPTFMDVTRPWLVQIQHRKGKQRSLFDRPAEVVKTVLASSREEAAMKAVLVLFGPLTLNAVLAGDRSTVEAKLETASIRVIDTKDCDLTVALGNDALAA